MQLDAFIGAGDTEPFGAGFLQSLRDGDGAETVGVGLHDGEDLGLARRHVFLDDAQIVLDRFERNFRPNGAAFELNRFFHRRLECQSPFQNFAA
jgi:hypothetical protein